MIRVSDEDLIRVYGERYDIWNKEVKKNRVIGTYYWGDEINLVDAAAADDPLIQKVQVQFYNYGIGKKVDGYIKKKSAGKKNGNKTYRPFEWRTGPEPHLLEAIFVDVQQGDATFIRTPDRKLILIDGGEGKFTARLLAALFPGTTEAEPLIVDALVITHGDADHFKGLTNLKDASSHEVLRKQIHVRIARYFHNGLVKTPLKIIENGKKRTRKQKERFGSFKSVGKKTYVTSIFDDPREAPFPNQPFTEWNNALDSLLFDPLLNNAETDLNEVLPRVERLEFGQHQAFNIFRKSNVDIQVLGPIVTEIDGAPALEFLKGEKNSISAGHTINGHSVVLRMRYGKVRFLLGGDLNTHSQERLLHRIKPTGEEHLRSEILKVPHHGSHEFDYGFLEKVNPVVSIVSSGDENAMKEYVHPRANLMAALGMCSRKPRPLIFSTELAAFFAYRGYLLPEQHKEEENGDLTKLSKSKQRGGIHAFQRLIFGAVRVRTDGSRVLVSVESANDGIKEAYAFYVDTEGGIVPDKTTIL